MIDVGSGGHVLNGVGASANVSLRTPVVIGIFSAANRD